MVALEIKGFIPNTMLDWDGMLASTVFLPRCNFRCPYCQNPELVLHPERLETVPFSVVKDFLVEREGWIEGICVTGGEPCLHNDIASFCYDLKSLGVGVKLDTNGSLPDVLEGLLAEGLVDFVAMDVKAPLEAGPYRSASGIDDPELVGRLRRSIEVIKGSGVKSEFRTTVVPILHGPAEIASVAELLAGGGGDIRYFLQHFSPRATLDPRYAELRPFTDDDMQAIAEQARRFIPGTAVRGAPAGLDQ